MDIACWQVEAGYISEFQKEVVSHLEILNQSSGLKKLTQPENFKLIRDHQHRK